MLEKITAANATVFDRLVQDYEEEFSPITKKEKGADGKYALDADWRPPNEGFYWKEEDKILGFCIKGFEGEVADILEFYILPLYRRRGQGSRFACAVFATFSGTWQVRQIEGADEARAFWRSVIDRYTSGNFVEKERLDPYWGPVTYQRFCAPPESQDKPPF